MSHGPRVFVTQKPAIWDGTKFIPHPDFHAEKAAEFGRLVYLLGPGRIYKERVPHALAQMDRTLRTFTRADYLLPAGDSVAVALGTMLASERAGGWVTLLKFLPRAGSYEPYRLEIEKEWDR
jgi:hypothetical protein